MTYVRSCLFAVCTLLLSAVSMAQSTDSFQLSKTFRIGSPGGWDYISVGPDKKIYVSHGTHVVILDEKKGDSVGVIPNTNGVHGIAFDEAIGKGYTSNGRNNSVTVFEIKTGKVLNQIPAGQNPDAILFDPFSKTIITCNGRSHDLSIIDPVTERVTATIALDGKPETAVSDEAGRILRWYGTSTDIDDRKHAEQKLRRSESFLTEGQRLSRTGSFSWRVETDEITWSEEVYRIFQIEQGTPVTLELIGSRVHPEDQAKLNDMIERARKAVSDFEYEHRLVMPDTSVKYLHLIAHGFRDNEGRLEYIGAIQDVTESKVAEEALNRARSELAHMARVTTLSALTASIAHEVNQPISAAITSAGACLRWLNRDRPDVQRAREAAMRIEDDGKRAAEIITHLKSFYKKDVSPQRELVLLDDVVGEMLLLLRSEADRHSVLMRTELTADLPSVSADRVQLQQVLMNLMLNGMEAMREGGELKISTGHEPGEVMVSVSDTGEGIPVDKMKEIFNAFVTTKAKGTGMGLAISSTIIESHGGRLWATANPGSGATFHFTLPTPEGGSGH